MNELVKEIQHDICYLRSKGKNINILPVCDSIFALYINNNCYGNWTVIGLISIIAQYRCKSYPDSFFASYGIPLPMEL
jgi:hypothetical protein